MTPRVDARVGWRVAIDAGADRRWFYVGDHDNNRGRGPQFEPHRPDGAGAWVPVAAWLPHAPIVFDSLEQARIAVERIAVRKADVLARMLIVVDPCGEIAARWSDFHPAERDDDACVTCGSRSLWRNAGGQLVCGTCGTIEEA